jgi:hypothetical protein
MSSDLSYFAAEGRKKMAVPVQNVIRVTKRGGCGAATRMLALLSRILLVLGSAFETGATREAEILLLRQQLLVLNRKPRKRVRLRNLDRLIVAWLCRLLPSVLDAVVIVNPRPCCAGIAAGSAPTGIGSLGGASAGPGSIANCGH